jgi:hypothetical protein
MSTTDFAISADVLRTIANDDDICEALVIPVRRVAAPVVDGWCVSAEDLASADDETITRLYPVSSDDVTVRCRRV